MAIHPQPAPILAAMEPQSSQTHASSPTKFGVPGPSEDRGIMAAKSPSVTKSVGARGLLHTWTDSKSTVIAELSFMDVMAILLVLMQLPYSVLGLIQVCFAFLTFGSLPTAWSPSSILHDLSQSHGGSPSIITMLIMDFLCGGALSISWMPKDFPMDLAQAVIAVSLGGGTSGRNGNAQSLLCFGIVGLHHLLGQRLWNIRYHILSVVCSVLNIASSSTKFGPFEPDDILDTLDVTPEIDRNWFRRVVELHIFAQGLLRILRRWIMHWGSVRRGESDPAFIPPGSPAVSANPAILDGGRNTSSDGRQPGPSPAPREGGREKSLSITKKKKKQATFVRSQQPFWAAIANTKVTVLKEIEQSKASQDLFEGGTRGVVRPDGPAHQSTGSRIWITHVSDTDVCFKLCQMTRPDSPGSADTPTEEGRTTQPLPFTVRVNGAEWSSASIESDESVGEKRLLKGKIFGLTSLTNYVVEVFQPQSQVLIHSVTLVTRPDPNLDRAPLEGSFRPSSPTSTLRKSISAAESHLSDCRNRSKRGRKNRQNNVNNLKKEIGKAESHLASTGNTDERQRQRSYQYNQSIKQAESMTESLAQQVQDLGEIPSDQRRAANLSKESLSTRKEAHAKLCLEVENTKSDFKKQVSIARGEATSLQKSQERYQNRLQKLQTQREALLAASEQEQQDQKRRDQTRLSEMAKAVDEERRLRVQLRNTESQRSNVNEQSAHLEQQLQFLEQGYVGNDVGVPQTPEGSFSNLAVAPNRLPSGLNPFHPMQPPIGTPPAQSRRSSVFKQTRVRSSSMLSNMSGFTEDEIDPGQQRPNGVNHGQNNPHLTAREGSVGSSGGSQRPGSSSRPNTTSPAPPKLSPIGAGRNSPWNTRNA
ncbi:MAG: hypothetical protein Q9162_003566 [Coniocarpon cinnabarinum]